MEVLLSSNGFYRMEQDSSAVYNRWPANHNVPFLDIVYSPVWSDYGIKEFALAAAHPAIPLKPELFIYGQLSDLTAAYLMELHIPLKQTSFFKAELSAEYAILQIKDGTDYSEPDLSLAFQFNPAPKFSIASEYSHIFKNDNHLLDQQSNITCFYSENLYCVSYGLSKTGDLPLGYIAGFNAGLPGRISVGMRYFSAQQMASVSGSIALSRFVFTQIAGWHQRLGLMMTSSVHIE